VKPLIGIVAALVIFANLPKDDAALFIDIVSRLRSFMTPLTGFIRKQINFAA
jgi:hypothetical protein